MTDEMKEQAFNEHYLKGIELEKYGQCKEARDEFQEAIILNPSVTEYLDAFQRMEKILKK